MWVHTVHTHSCDHLKGVGGIHIPNSRKNKMLFPESPKLRNHIPNPEIVEFRNPEIKGDKIKNSLEINDSNPTSRKRSFRPSYIFFRIMITELFKH